MQHKRSGSDNKMVNIEEKVKEFLPYVRNLSFCYSKKLYSLNIEFDDLYQVGSLAIVEACYSYDDTKASFFTYVYNRIRFAMLDYITNNSFAIVLPSYMINSIRLIVNKNQEYYQCYGCQAPIDFLIDALKEKKYSKRSITEEYIMYLKKLNEFYLKSNVTSYEELDEDSILLEEDVEGKAIDMYFIEPALSILSELTERDRDILEKRLGLNNYEPTSYRALAKDSGITFQAVEQSYKKSLRKIRKKLNISD